MKEEVFQMRDEVVEVLRIIGSPYRMTQNRELKEKEKWPSQTLLVSESNKIPVLYLESAKRIWKDDPELQSLYDRYRLLHKRMLNDIKRVASVLRKSTVEFCIFKTLKPYPFVGSDIDILFFRNSELERAYNVLRSMGYTTTTLDPDNVTLYNPDGGLRLDLYREASVSRIRYANKNQLRDYLTSVLIDGVEVPSLSPEIDLLVSMGHSLFKEQMFTLADFYHVIHRFKAFSKKEISRFIGLAERQGYGFTVNLTLGLASTLHELVYNKSIPVFEQVNRSLAFKGGFLISKEKIKLADTLELPHKYCFLTAAMAISTKLVTSGNLARQLSSLLDPIFFRNFFERLVWHITRETY